MTTYDDDNQKNRCLSLCLPGSCFIFPTIHTSYSEVLADTFVLLLLGEDAEIMVTTARICNKNRGLNYVCQALVSYLQQFTRCHWKFWTLRSFYGLPARDEKNV